jgi:predicted N-acyltransferase
LDACALAGRPYNPFISHDFLKAVEESGSATQDTGWLPHHLLLEDSSGALIGCMPCYLKSHSLGEYVFDHGWADAYMRAGGRYYPKLQASIPFTPVTGRRLLVPAGVDQREREAILLQAAIQVTNRLGVSSLHVTFLTREEWQLAGDIGFLQRTDQQFHWLNEGYGSFEDFLAALAARKRKAIRKERREAIGDGIEIEWMTGRDLTEAHFDAFFAFYMDTGSRKWGSPYLTRSFFSLIGEAMREHVLLVIARRAGRMIAGALNFIGSHGLFGRNWGALEQHPFLHFELCYYRAIDFAIARKIARVEAGAQGPHKLARGYLPQVTRSLHYLAHPGLARAVAEYLAQERAAIAHDRDALARHSPFRQEQDF